MGGARERGKGGLPIDIVLGGFPAVARGYRIAAKRAAGKARRIEALLDIGSDADGAAQIPVSQARMIQGQQSQHGPSLVAGIGAGLIAVFDPAVAVLPSPQLRRAPARPCQIAVAQAAILPEAILRLRRENGV